MLPLYESMCHSDHSAPPIMRRTSDQSCAPRSARMSMYGHGTHMVSLDQAVRTMCQTEGRAGERLLRPFEAYSPLVVDSDAELSLAVSPQRFETATRPSGEVPQRDGGLKTV